MKNIFGIFKKPEDNNFSKFVLRKLSDENADKAENLSNEGDDLSKKKVPPKWLYLVSVVAIGFGLLFVVLMFFAKDGFVYALQTRVYFFYIGIGLFVVGLIIQIIVRIKNKKFNSDPEVEDYATRVDVAVKECEFELNIPETATKMDILFVVLKKNKKGEEKLSLIGLVQYINQELKVFIENDLLCFADSYMVLGIPLNSVKGIKTINKKIPLPQWNKPEMFNSPAYKQYKLYTNTSGFIWNKPYYEVDFNIDGEDYCLFLPCYEKEAFLRLFDSEVPNLD